jgi:hypothetical protein
MGQAKGASSRVNTTNQPARPTTGTMGLKGNLTAGEIVEQLVHASRVVPVRNVVFMVRRTSGPLIIFVLTPDCSARSGSINPASTSPVTRDAPRLRPYHPTLTPPPHHTNPLHQCTTINPQGMGEPLSNYDAVCAAVQMMTDPRLFGLSRRHVTVSTVGVAPKIREMAKDLPVRGGGPGGGGLALARITAPLAPSPDQCCPLTSNKRPPPPKRRPNHPLGRLPGAVPPRPRPGAAARHRPQRARLPPRAADGRGGGLPAADGAAGVCGVCDAGR